MKLRHIKRATQRLLVRLRRMRRRRATLRCLRIMARDIAKLPVTITKFPG
jgi:CBS-domain-containing membrane protein